MKEVTAGGAQRGRHRKALAVPEGRCPTQLAKFRAPAIAAPSTCRWRRCPRDLNDCQCEHCQKRGTLWAYYTPDQVEITGATSTYRWGRSSSTSTSAPGCGITTHWSAVDPSYKRMGINARVFGRDVFQPIPQRKGYPGGG